MAARLSTRLSIRWVPGEPSEPTDTLVMSVGGWFVDLRITKQDGSIDWGMAGERFILSEKPFTCKWTHWIDSNGYTEPDIGSFEPVESPGSTDSIETGSMLNPETNIVTPYEEVWRSLPASFGELFTSSWIIRSIDKRTFIGRVGGDYLALKGGSEGPVGMKGFCARRETWEAERGSWTVKYAAGDKENLSTLPSINTYVENGQPKEQDWEKTSKEGDVVEVFGEKYIVCAIER
ncbi:hypothetical protein A1O3_09811 [Capronia epimyces CBS 606.96]|uniref:Protein HRI1 n=1 Tax=Capronia epimyces CBS 606.96 TaxID=1182542 RepID=W9Y552_9EURO|nr:uncharacterized protein A1O3_09811 [Capronia epimyces CBS 606.96]EXJ77584.1 hypothetical protein A1O3_09811 [Capronia epimyces CBS 606.96]